MRQIISAASNWGHIHEEISWRQPQILNFAYNQTKVRQTQKLCDKKLIWFLNSIKVVTKHACRACDYSHVWSIGYQVTPLAPHNLASGDPYKQSWRHLAQPEFTRTDQTPLDTYSTHLLKCYTIIQAGMHRCTEKQTHSMGCLSHLKTLTQYWELFNYVLPSAQGVKINKHVHIDCFKINILINF